MWWQAGSATIWKGSSKEYNIMKLLFKNCSILANDGMDGYAPLSHGYLGIDGDSIAYIGEERPAAAYDLEKDMHGALLCPGLINCHGHAAMVLLRGLGSGLPLDRWLNEAIFPVEDRLCEADIVAGNALAQMEMLACGTTSYSDMYDKPLTAITLCEQSGMKVNLGRPILSFDPKERAADSSRVQETLALFKNCHMAQSGRVRVDFSIHAEYTNHEEIVREYALLCLQHGGRMQLHLSETQQEHAACKAKYGKTPARWFYDLGVFRSPTAAAHCVMVEPADMDILKSCGVSIIHNPSSNLKLGSGFAPIPAMLDMGINLALGTDGAASNNNLNMFEEMHLAAVMHKGYQHDPMLLSPAQVLNMATRNGAALQGRADTGALAVGKKADIIAISLDGPHMLPAFDPLSMLVYSAQGSDVILTMVDGKILYENGDWKTIDAERTRHEVSAALKRLYD